MAAFVKCLYSETFRIAKTPVRAYFFLYKDSMTDYDRYVTPYYETAFIGLFIYLGKELIGTASIVFNLLNIKTTYKR